MNPAAFRRRYEGVWDELEGMIRARGRRGDGGSAERLGRLYRETNGHLAFARTYFPESELTGYLNGLVGRAYLRLYGRSGGEWVLAARFFAAEFPRAVRRAWPFFLAAWVVMTVGGAIGFGEVLRSEQALYALMPASLASAFHPAAAGPHPVDHPLMATLIMTHNMMVTFQAFFGAFTLGILTLYALYFNGLLLGALAALFLRAGRSYLFWSLILPHGVTELTAISIGGAAGLMVAYRFLVPGRLTRGESLRAAASDAGRLLIGVMAMLAIAGTIEGFLTPSAVSAGLKYLVAGATALGWIAYFSLAGRRGH